MHAKIFNFHNAATHSMWARSLSLLSIKRFPENMLVKHFGNLFTLLVCMHLTSAYTIRNDRRVNVD